MSHPTLITLPSEVLEAVFRKLDYIYLLQCCSVCRLLKTVIDESSELQYIIELGRDGMLDHNALGLSHAERLAKLRDLRAAWNNLAWKTRSVIPMEGLCHAYELVEGLFIKGAGGDHFSIFWLPSATDEGHQVHRNDLQIPARDFAIDPGQDLIIFIDDTSGALTQGGMIVKLHIRTISTHEVHKSARQSILQFTVPQYHILGTFIRTIMLELADDMLAVFLCTGNYRLLIWNWKEGILITDSYLPGHDLPILTWDFAFINSRSYILTSKDTNGSIQIYGLEAKRLMPPTHIASLHLPELEQDSTVRNITTHTGPLNTPSSNRPFVRSPASRIHVLCVQYNTLYHSPTRYCTFLHNRVFLSHLALYTSGVAAAGSQVPWEEWGPKNARMFIGNAPFTWLRYVHGQRVVCPQDADGPLRFLQILDFNVRPDVPSVDSKAIKTVCTEPTSLPTGQIFRRKVVTHLPYSIMVREISDNYSAFMIDEDKIVGLKAQGFEEEELKALHVYTF